MQERPADFQMSVRDDPALTFRMDQTAVGANHLSERPLQMREKSENVPLCGLERKKATGHLLRYRRQPAAHLTSLLFSSLIPASAKQVSADWAYPKAAAISFIMLTRPRQIGHSVEYLMNWTWPSMYRTFPPPGMWLK